MQKHRFNIFPEMNREDYERLKNDLSAHGYDNSHPIYLYEGSILDGWNRQRACKELDIKPAYQKFQGDEEAALFFVMRTNHRRNLDSSQWACIAVLAEDILRILKEAAKARMTEGRNQHSPVQLIAQPTSNEDNKTRSKLASMFNTNRTYIDTAQKIKEAHPEKFEATLRGDKTLSQISREVKQEKRATQLMDAKKDMASKSFSTICDIRNISMEELLTSGIKPNCIITDPPYPREFLPLYEDLAKLSQNIPLVAVMCGQSYLPEIISSMCKYLKYRWMIAYLTPGGQAVQQWQTKVNAFWKPVILFGDSVEWIGDVCKSNVNDNDKRFHGWGQSESGMADLVERLSKPGDLICDPFCGAGTTGVAALSLGRKFIGSDIDDSHVQMAISRCMEIVEHER